MIGEPGGLYTRPTSLRVVDAVATDREVEPTELEPLYRTIDPDSLDRMFPATDQKGGRTGPNLTFTFARRRVSVAGDGSVDVASTSDAHDRAEHSTEPSTAHASDHANSDATQPTD